MSQNQTSKNQVSPTFWQRNAGLFMGLGVVALLVALLFARLAFAEQTWATVLVLVLLVADVILLIRHNQHALRSRTAAYGLNSLVTILLVFGLLGMGNFMASRYPKKIDLTRNKINTLSDQTIKVLKNLKQPVKLTMFAKTTERQRYQMLLDNYRNVNTGKFDVEYVDPDREPTRARAAGIKKYGTALISVNGRQSKVEQINEEKLTNALIKLTRDKTPTLCSIIGHGEKSFTSNTADGLAKIKQALSDQSYEVKEINLMQEQDKVPSYCDAIAILGPTKSFFDPEVKAIRDYLKDGGRAVIALDVNIKGSPYAPELLPVLADWNIKPENALIVDPVSRMFNVDASMPIIANFSKTNPITRDFGSNTPSAFPIARPLDVTTTVPGINPVAIGKTTAQSFAVTDFRSIASGQVKVDPHKTQRGPFDVALAVNAKAKDSKAKQNTRLVVFGSSLFATNNFSRFGVNLDFYVNAVSWVLHDNSMISIRAKTDGPGKVNLSARSGNIIFLLTVVVIPILIAAAGVVNWTLRRRL